MEKTTSASELLQPLAPWIHSHMLKAVISDEPTKFNVFSYTQAQKDEAITELSKNGYNCELSPDKNSLAITIK